MSPNTGLIRLAIHGGAGNTPDGGHTTQSAQCAELRRIVTEVWRMLLNATSALDAVTQAVVMLEEYPLFNAGVGAVLNRDGQPELDAAVMSGIDRTAGAVACVSRVKSPVRLARTIMERTPHTFLAGAGAERIAAELIAQDLVDPSYFITQERQSQLRAAQLTGAITLDHDHSISDDPGFGTVGAVARDSYGHLAAATSTGGLTNKLPGRIGDTPIIGAGTFADDSSAAISCTGTGEAFMRSGFGFLVHARVAFCGWDLQRACAESLKMVSEYGGKGGCIAIDHNGRVTMPFNSKCMYRAWIDANGAAQVSIGQYHHN